MTGIAFQSKWKMGLIFHKHYTSNQSLCVFDHWNLEISWNLALKLLDFELFNESALLIAGLFCQEDQRKNGHGLGQGITDQF